MTNRVCLSNIYLIQNYLSVKYWIWYSASLITLEDCENFQKIFIILHKLNNFKHILHFIYLCVPKSTLEVKVQDIGDFEVTSPWKSTFYKFVSMKYKMATFYCSKSTLIQNLVHEYDPKNACSRKVGSLHDLSSRVRKSGTLCHCSVT